MNTEDNKPKKTKVELVDAMQRLYIEISSITEQIDMLKEEAKEQGMPAAMMAKVASLRATAKIDSVLEKNAELEALAEEIDAG